MDSITFIAAYKRNIPNMYILVAIFLLVIILIMVFADDKSLITYY